MFRDPNGIMIVNGAMGVEKIKKMLAGPVECLRFICILCPFNECARRLRGGSHTMPYLGRAVLIQMEDAAEEMLVVDSADIEGAFNVFTIPDEWLPYFCFAKPVPASIIGGCPSRMIDLSMRTLPMGCVFATDLIQLVARTLVFHGRQGGSENRDQK